MGLDGKNDGRIDGDPEVNADSPGTHAGAHDDSDTINDLVELGFTPELMAALEQDETEDLEPESAFKRFFHKLIESTNDYVGRIAAKVLFEHGDWAMLPDDGAGQKLLFDELQSTFLSEHGIACIKDESNFRDVLEGVSTASELFNALRLSDMQHGLLNPKRLVIMRKYANWENGVEHPGKEPWVKPERADFIAQLEKDLDDLGYRFFVTMTPASDPNTQLSELFERKCGKLFLAIYDEGTEIEEIDDNVAMGLSVIFDKLIEIDEERFGPIIFGSPSRSISFEAEGEGRKFRMITKSKKGLDSIRKMLLDAYGVAIVINEEETMKAISSATSVTELLGVLSDPDLGGGLTSLRLDIIDRYLEDGEYSPAQIEKDSCNLGYAHFFATDSSSTEGSPLSGLVVKKWKELFEAVMNKVDDAFEEAADLCGGVSDLCMEEESPEEAPSFWDRAWGKMTAILK